MKILRIIIHFSLSFYEFISASCAELVYLIIVIKITYMFFIRKIIKSDIIS